MRSRKSREQQELNTSSLPDIVFMILFFFMAIGMFPPPQPKIENDIIEVESAIELEDNGNYIHVRVSKDEIQLDYEVINIDDLTQLLTEIKNKNIVILHIDNDTPMGIVRTIVEPAILAAKKSKISYEVTIPDEENQL